jgi:hypothetical protein
MNCKYLVPMGKVRVHRIDHLTLTDDFSSPTAGRDTIVITPSRILDNWKVEIAEYGCNRIRKEHLLIER